jgi:hypothetical protein
MESKLLAFLRKLQEANIHYSLEHNRDYKDVSAIMVLVDVPGERWEIEFIGDGTVEVERFKSDGTIDDESALESLFARFSS